VVARKWLTPLVHGCHSPGGRAPLNEGAGAGDLVLMVTRRLRDGIAIPLSALRRTARHRTLLRVQASWAAVMTASWAATVALTVVAYGAGGSRAVALALVARSVPSAVAGAAAGALVDRVARRRAMAAAAAVSAVGCAGAAAAGEAVVAVVVLITLVALATMVFRTAQSAVMPELVDSPADLTAANVLSSAIESLGVFAGPALAGLLIAVQGPSSAFAVAAGLFVAAAVLLLGPAGARPAPAEAGHRERGTLELLRLSAPRLILLLLLAQTTVSGGLAVLYPALAVEALDVGESGVGLLVSAFGVGGVLGSVVLFALAGSSRLGLYSCAGLLLWSVPLLLVPFLPGLSLALILLSVVGAGNALFDVTVVTLLQRAVPHRLLGRAFGVFESVVVIGIACGAAAAAALEGPLGPARAVAGLGAVLAAVALLGLVPLRRLDASLAAPVRQIELLRQTAPFALLPTPELERLALRLQRSSTPAGEAVVRQGEPGRHWFVVDEGELLVLVDGREVARLGPGDAFGEIALLREGLRTATIQAVLPSRLWALDGTDFLAVLTSNGTNALRAVDAVVRTHLLRAAPVGAAEAAAPAGSEHAGSSARSDGPG
jgi:MFS family permease